MRPLFTADEMRHVDRRATRELGIPGAVLMENAGRGAAEAIQAFLAARGLPHRGASVVVVAGKGGNGGDGFVVARWLHRWGQRARVLLAAPPGEVGGDAAAKLADLRADGVTPEIVEDPAAVALDGADVVVDALLGTGARGAPEPRVAALIERVNAVGTPIVALDVPSGLPADGGAPAGAAIRAALTVTFAGLKRGLVTGPGAELAGNVRVVDIGVPRAEVERDVTTFLLEAADVAPLFPPRPRDAHKGRYGALLVVAGSIGKTGAAALAARAAMRSGAGLVTIATAVSQQPVVAGLVLEAMTEPLAETAAHSPALAARPALDVLADARDACALGPGLGLDAETQALARALVAELPRPMAVDADGLTALAGHLEVLRRAAAPRCLTPHPGEMARMLETNVAAVERDRIGCVRAFATAQRAHVVLKGAGSVIGAPDGRVFVNPTGNPGMASGGMGDVLTGMLGAFLARRFDALQALQAAVYLHGLAGDLAAKHIGEEPLIASDVIAAIPDAFRALLAVP